MTYLYQDHLKFLENKYDVDVDFDLILSLMQSKKVDEKDYLNEDEDKHEGSPKAKGKMVENVNEVKKLLVWQEMVRLSLLLYRALVGLVSMVEDYLDFEVEECDDHCWIQL